MKRGGKPYLRMLLKQNGKCFYCYKELWTGKPEHNADCKRGDLATIDHIKPRSKGGSNRKENIVISCQECNLAKADRIYSNEYRFRDIRLSGAGK